MLREIYFGKVVPWERRNRKSAEHLELLREIECEELYLLSRLSPEDCERFNKFLALQSDFAASEESEIFSYGFSMGAMLMLDMTEEVEAMKIR